MTGAIKILSTRLLRLLMLASFVLLVPECVQGADADGGVKTEFSTKGPVGLFFMVRYYSATRTLEKAAWYFSPQGEAYENLQDGFSNADLAAHKGRKGTFKVADKTLEVIWPDGKKTTADYEPDATGFGWDMGSFTPVKPFGDAKLIAGSYEGGESLSRGGSSVAVSKSLELRPDGTYSLEGVSTLKAGELGAGAQSSANGTWKAEGYALTLTGSDGKTIRKLAFPYDDAKTRRIYFGGTMYKRR